MNRYIDGELSVKDDNLQMKSDAEMDNICYDTYFFSVPNRNLWDNWNWSEFDKEVNV